MVELFQLLLLILVNGLSLSGIGFTERSGLVGWIRQVAGKQRLVVIAVGCTTFLGCMAVAGVLHEPVPRVHDEFSYLLMSETFASGHVVNPSPPLPQFFDTFHVLIHPVYASK